MVSLPPSSVLANPAGEQVVGGSATFDRTGGTLSITTSDRAIINWADFSIQVGETTKFFQPNSFSATLNRVTSSNPSSLLGSLQANGQIYLINPNGILVGPGANINTANFVGSTLDVQNNEFMTGGDLHFVGSSLAGIQNQGTISAIGGNVILMAHQIENSGTIQAAEGVVGLGAGTEFYLKQSGSEIGLVQLPVSGTAGAGTGILNQGVIDAAQADLKAYGNIYQFALNNEGTIRARGAVQKDGHVYLTSVGGTIQNSGLLEAHNADGSGGTVIMQALHDDTTPSTTINSGTIDVASIGTGLTAGEVRVLGDRVGLFNHSMIDARGDAGGGTVLVGGDYQGKNAAIQNASKTYVGYDSIVLADALVSGNGGKVINWSDDGTIFHGFISAKGGSQGGNGGFVEVSGHHYLKYDGKVSLEAVLGKAGELLLDPDTITIIDTFGSNGTSGGVIGVTLNPPSDQTLAFADNSGTAITLDISDLTTLTSGTIRLQADTQIDLNASWLLPNNVNVIMEVTSGNINTTADLGTQGSGSITLKAQGGAINLAARIIAGATGDIFLSSSSFANTAGAGNGEISALAGDITIEADTITLANTITGNGDLWLRPLSTTRAVTLGGAGAFDLTATEIGQFSGAGSTFNNVIIGRPDTTAATTISGNITFNDSVEIYGAGITRGTTSLTVNQAGGTAYLDALTGSLLGTGTINAPNVELYADVDIGASANPVATAGGNLTLYAGRDIFATRATSVVLDDVFAGRDFILGLSAGSLTLGGPVDAGGTLSLSVASAGSITGSGQVSANSLTLSTGVGDIGAAGAPIFTDANSITISRTGPGNIFIAEADDVVISSISGSTGNVVFDAGGPVSVTGNIVGNFIKLASHGDLNLVAGTITANGTGDALKLATDTRLNVSAGSITTPNGRFLVYSFDPTLNILGSIPLGTEFYGINFSVPGPLPPPPAGAAGNLFFYKKQPYSTTTVNNFNTSSTQYQQPVMTYASLLPPPPPGGAITYTDAGSSSGSMMPPPPPPPPGTTTTTTTTSGNTTTTTTSGSTTTTLASNNTTTDGSQPPPPPPDGSQPPPPPTGDGTQPPPPAGDQPPADGAQPKPDGEQKPGDKPADGEKKDGEKKDEKKDANNQTANNSNGKKDDHVLPAGMAMVMGGGNMPITATPPVLQKAISVEVRNELANFLK